MDIGQFFRIADNNLKCNTAYPVFKDAFLKYKSESDILADTEELSFYIHIPFCKQLCRFCEYTKFLAGNDEAESRYLSLLSNQIDRFLNTHNIKRIYGLDIGGGTPTSLSEENFRKMLNLSARLEAFDKIPDYEKSIEISFSTITESKIEEISHHGFKRVSVGMQSIDRTLMDENHRVYSRIEDICRIKEKIHSYGIPKLNIDLMYGMTNQTEYMIKNTLDAIAFIHPEQVTLYETRFNRNQMDFSKVDRELQYQQYSYMYQYLTDIGYKGFFGRNTFSVYEDKGVSSYLKYRMEQCIPYKGFGISAQSMSFKGLSYGIFKNTDKTTMPDLEEITNGSNYILPKEEILAKYVCIAMYHGNLNLNTMEKILSENPLTVYKAVFDYLFLHDFIKQSDEIVYLTEKGFRYYGAIAALFWSEEQKERLVKNYGCL